MLICFLFRDGRTDPFYPVCYYGDLLRIEIGWFVFATGFLDRSKAFAPFLETVLSLPLVSAMEAWLLSIFLVPLLS